MPIVIEEWLYESGVNIDDKLIFERSHKKNGTSIKIADKFQKTQKAKLRIEVMEDFLESNELLLSNSKKMGIDEIDQSLHPVLLYSLVSKIMDDETTKGQFIFTTHEANLLDLKIFRQDEIWFAEKDKKTSANQLYSLSEFKPRNDLDIRKGYLNGRFGAIPFLAHLEDLN